MSISLVYGDLKTGKTTHCIGKATELISQGKQVVFIVPEQYSMEVEGLINEKIDSKLSGNIEVRSFLRLANSVFSKYGPLYKNILDNSGKYVIIQDILLKLQDKLLVLGVNATHPDFPNVILTIITEFKRYMVTVETLRNAAGTMGDNLLKFKLLDLAMLLEEFEKRVTFPLCNVDGNLDMLLVKMNQFELFSDTYIIIDGFTDFTVQEESVIKYFLDKSPQVTVTLTTDSLEPGSEFDIFCNSKRTAKKLLDYCKEVSCFVEQNLCIRGIKGKNVELAHLQENFYNYPPNIYEKNTENIEIFTAKNPYFEIENIAIKIVKLCRKEGYRFRDFGVVCRNITPYLPIIRQIFEEYGIFYNATEKASINKNAIFSAILSLLDAVCNNLNYNSLMKWLKSSVSGFLYDDISYLENYILAIGVTPTLWTREWKFLPYGYSDADLERLNQLKFEILEPINKFKSKFHGRKTYAEITVAFYELLMEMEICEKMEIAKDTMTVEQSREFTTMWGVFCGFLDQIHQFAGDKYVTFENYYISFKAGAEGLSVGSVPSCVDQVEILEVEKFAMSKPIVFLIAINEGIFPARFATEGLISDKERTLLAENNVQLADTSYAKQIRENYLIYRVISGATQKLFLSFYASTLEGKGASPSFVVSRFKNIFPNIKQDDNVYGETKITQIEGAIPTLPKVMCNAKKAGMWTEIRRWYEANMGDSYRNILKVLQYTNVPQNISKNLVNTLYGEDMYGSISRGETFFRCEYSYFLKYGLKVKPRRKYELAAPDLGSFMHKVIEEFSNKISENDGWQELTKEDCKEYSEKLTQTVAQEMFGEEIKEFPPFARSVGKISKIMFASLWNISSYYKNTPFVNLGNEITFEKNGNFEPIRLELSDGSHVELVGKIDRADVYKGKNGDLISVVDYKSSSKTIDYTDILAGIQLQLPAYIKAICDNIGGDIAKIPASMYYFHINAPVVKGNKNMVEGEIEKQVKNALKMRGLTADYLLNDEKMSVANFVKTPVKAQELEKICNLTYEKLKVAFEGIKMGSIKINPYNKKGETPCEWCDYGNICGFDPTKQNNNYRRIKTVGKDYFSDENEVKEKE